MSITHDGDGPAGHSPLRSDPTCPTAGRRRQLLLRPAARDKRVIQGKGSIMRDVSRRTFVGTAAAGIAAAAGGVAKASEASDAQPHAEGSATSGSAVSAWGQEYPWPSEPPQIDDADVEEELEADVVVIGLGVSGVAAFRAAAEAGAKTVAFEKAEAPSVRSQQYAYINGTMTERLGLATVDEDEVINHEWCECGKMTDYAIVREFVRNESDVFDWWVNGDPDMYIPEQGEVIAMTGDENHPVSISNMSDPAADYEDNPQCGYPTRLALTDHEHVVNANLQDGIDAGGAVYFGHFAEQLITIDGRCVGAYVRNAETGKYKKVTVGNGVILSAGGCGSNKDMVRTFYPSMAENGNLVAWPNLDVEGNPTNTGDGYRMGYWAGAGFSQMMAPMCHVMGGPNDVANMAASMGLTSPHLRLNYDGDRFMNEDSNCSDCELAFDQQPKRKAFLVFDSHLDEQLPDCFLDFPTTLADMDGKVDNETVFKGETLEELFGAIVAFDADFDAEEALASVKHYNQLCDSGVDDDFGKRAKYLWPVVDGPFYAQRMGIGMCLTTMGGLLSDEHAHVLTPDHRIIPGLYVSGNTQGGRFAVKYPFKLSGASHAMAMYYGYVAGTNAAAGE